MRVAASLRNEKPASVVRSGGPVLLLDAPACCPLSPERPGCRRGPSVLDVLLQARDASDITRLAAIIRLAVEADVARRDQMLALQ
jgi:hypothetical protein